MDCSGAFLAMAVVAARTFVRRSRRGWFAEHAGRLTMLAEDMPDKATDTSIHVGVEKEDSEVH
jgi:hypothetical protein